MNTQNLTTNTVVVGGKNNNKSRSKANSIINLATTTMNNNNNEKMDSLPLKSWVETGGYNYLSQGGIDDLMQDTAQTDFEDDDEDLGLIVVSFYFSLINL